MNDQRRKITKHTDFRRSQRHRLFVNIARTLCAFSRLCLEICLAEWKTREKTTNRKQTGLEREKIKRLFQRCLTVRKETRR